jgi:ribosomal-protein-alanine N-acetyltransferase
MNYIPTLESTHLRLRPLLLIDAADVQLLAGAPEIADTTLHIPHPYPDGLAERWISGRPEAAQNGTELTWAVADRVSDRLCGAISLAPTQAHQRAELGYWMGHPFWGRGYMTEAATAVVAYGFTTLNLQRIYAYHFARNPASGRVMQKIGMTYEGCMRQHLRKGAHVEDIKIYSILRQEWS